MRINKLLLLLWLLVLTTIGAKADIIKGKVIDTQSGTPLSDVSVEAVVHTGSFTITQNSVTDSLGRFSIDFFVTGHASLSFSFLGYKTVHKAQYVFSRVEGNDTIDLGTIGMKPTATILKTIEVTGHLPRITMNGDTIVFNPEAYKLEDNARIIDLLKAARRDDARRWLVLLERETHQTAAQRQRHLRRRCAAHTATRRGCAKT